MNKNFSIGDMGRTGNGLFYKVTNIDHDQEPYPMEVYIFDESNTEGYFYNYTLDGQSLLGQTSPYDLLISTSKEIDCESYSSSVLADDEQLDYVATLNIFDIMVKRTGQTNTLLKNLETDTYSLYTHKNGQVYPDVFTVEDIFGKLKSGEWVYLDDDAYYTIDFNELQEAIENYLDAYRSAKEATKEALDLEQEVHQAYSRILHSLENE